METELITQDIQKESETLAQQESLHIVNPYPKLRHILLVLCLLFVVSIFILLLYQNGKSIYDNGI
jgi:hypothetical protein